MYAQPMMAVVPKTPQQIAGEQAAQTSMTLGVIGLVLLLTGFGGVITLILGIIGVKKAAEAERQGVPATGGKVMGWISLIGGGLLTILAILAIGFVIIAFIAAASAGSSSTRSYLDLAYTFAPLMSLL
jgi:DNA translocase ftsK